MLAHRCGVGSDYVAKCERGEMNMTLEKIAQVSKGLRLDPSKLFESR